MVATYRHDDAVDHVVATYRLRRPCADGPRVVEGITVWEDPAPRWVAELCQCVAMRTTDVLQSERLAMLQDACAWCDAGDPLARSDRLMRLLDDWAGPRAPMLRMFITNVRLTKAGKQRTDLPVNVQRVGGRLGALMREYGLPVWPTSDRSSWHTLSWLAHILDNRAPTTTRAELQLVWEKQRALSGAYRLGGEVAVQTLWIQMLETL